MRHTITKRKAKELAASVEQAAPYFTKKEYDEVIKIVANVVAETCKERGVFKSAT